MIEPSSFEPISFVQQLIHVPTLHEVPRFLERHLPLGLPDDTQAALLDELRKYGNQSDKAWHIVMAIARLTPQAAAVGWHTYGRSLHAEPLPKTEPLIVATAAYRWAGDDFYSARAAVGLSTRLYVESKYEDAIRYGEEAIAILKQRHALHPWEYSAALITTAASYADQTSLDRVRKAYALCEMAVDVAEAALASADLDAGTRRRITGVLAEACITIGRVCEESFDDLRRAEDYYAQAERVLASTDPDDLPNQRFRLALNTAVLALRLGRHATATKRLAYAEQFLDPDNALDAVELALYRLYQSVTLGDYKGARAYRRELNRHLRTANKNLSSPLPRAVLQEARATIFAAQIPQRNAGKYRALGATLAAARTTLGKSEVKLDAVLALIEQARVAYLARDIPSGRQLVAEARAEIQKHNLPRRALELEALYAMRDPAVTAVDLSKLVRQVAKAGDYVTAAALSTKLGQYLENCHDPRRALRAYHRAIKDLDRAHRLFFRVTHQNIHFFANQREPFERAFALLVESRAADAFMMVERVKAQTLTMEMHTHDTFRNLLERHPRLKQIHDLRLALEYNHPPSSPFNVSALDAETPLPAMAYSPRAKLEQAYERALMELQAEDDREIDEAVWLNMQPLSLQTIQDMLAPETALLSYFVVDTPGPRAGLWVSIVTCEGATVQHATSQEDLQAFLEVWTPHWQQMLDPQTEEGVKSIADIPDIQRLLQALDTFFIQPAMEVVAATNARHLTILSDKPLPLLPFHAAHNRHQGYLIERYSVSYAPSATILHHCYRREQQRVGNNKFLVAGWEERDLSIKHGLELVSAHLKVPYAHNSLAKEDLLAALPHARLVHVAAHGTFNKQNYSRFSCLHLYRETTDPSQAPIYEELSAHDLYSIQLNADLFVLNACHLGKHDDNFQGMTSAALVAGASSVVAGMWAVYARTAPQFMNVFYAHLRDTGATRAEALRQAQLAFIRHSDDPDLSHPAYWAPFVITGVATLPFRF